MDQAPCCDREEIGHVSKENEIDAFHREMDEKGFQQTKSRLNNRDRTECKECVLN